MKTRMMVVALLLLPGCPGTEDTPDAGETGNADTEPGTDTGTETTGGDESGGMFAEPCVPVTIDASACDPEVATFTLDSTNRFYPLTPGLSVTLEGYNDEDEVTETVERTVLEETRTIAGVEVHVLEHIAYHDGEVFEIAYNFYVEASDGTVCYFGEDVEFYEDGDLTGMEGTWRVGVDGAKPGVIMPAMPAVGDVYYQEVAPTIAEDMGHVTELGGTASLGGTDFTDVLTIMDSNPIDDEDVCEEERKLYAPGIGEIADVELEYVSHTLPG